ncbi:MAG: prolipoprotein diacylglyceryl transferase, partial [Thermoleophilaceae bacterium]|nr:prolipoprotein diacylglyceryl transferase [Thermoleophilaceae bacterium]
MLVTAGALATITIGLDPMIELGPVTLTWHGLTIALGLALGTVIASRYAKRSGLDSDALFSAGLWLVAAGLAGARLVYLAENDAADLLQPGEWLGARGFSFYGGMIFGTLAAGVVLWRRGLGARYLDAMAYGFPLGMALGRVGDLINGEHYGAPTDAPWGIRYTSPAAEVPSPDIAYHAGGLYEIVLALLVAAALYGLGKRLRKPGALLWTAIALY